MTDAFLSTSPFEIATPIGAPLRTATAAHYGRTNCAGTGTFRFAQRTVGWVARNLSALAAMVATGRRPRACPGTITLRGNHRT